MTEYKECESCPGYCCITNSTTYTPLTNDDINRIAAYLKIPFDRFMREFVVSTMGRIQYTNSPDAIAHIKTLGPCPFLRQGLCAINEVKPIACRDAELLHLGNIPCAMWYKMKWGGATNQPTEVVINAPNANAGFS